MKKTSTVKVPERKIKATTKKVESVYCDICLRKLKKGERYTQCSICSRDLCMSNLSEVGCTVYDPDDYGDYPNKFCTICADLIIKPRRELEDKHWKEQEELEAKVKKESLSYDPQSYKLAK